MRANAGQQQHFVYPGVSARLERARGLRPSPGHLGQVRKFYGKKIHQVCVIAQNCAKQLHALTVHVG